MKHGLGSAVGRVAAVIGGLLLVGIVLRLILAILSPILPSGLMQIVTAGWNTLYGIVSPALPALAAVATLAALVWVLVGRRR
ncbi:hypothetical protein [Amycolatopsis sp. H20-H5]|uniref:hypothetical protein n=1 Tax=Amycolatopsis sp. H20-H5 TaxID=3046309 RepID=UPI002DBFDBAB|nr:hypothetical protein [Amycolatopsis sp. H20-H5]MEC3980406.1 hypothetical protein [Amycolatopsis sp. H20-H5]